MRWVPMCSNKNEALKSHSRGRLTARFVDPNMSIVSCSGFGRSPVLVDLA